MSLDTFCRITEALKTTPAYILCDDKEKLSYNERFEMITAGSVMEEMEYILFMIEKMIEGRNRFKK